MANSAPTSGQPIQAGGNQLAMLTQLLPQLFGSTQTSTANPGDTAALQQLLQQLQGADYSSTLQSIFQQASGQIPGLQAAFSNAVGARSGNNSAVQAALSKLMQETTLAGQKQVADQQLQNQQLQAQAGASIANATAGTRQTKKTDGSIGQLTAMLGLVQAAKAATGARDLEELGRKLGLGGSPGRDAGAVPVSGATAGAPVGGAAPVVGAAAPAGFGAAGGNFDLSAAFQAPGMGSMEWAGGSVLDPQFNNFSDMFAFNANELSAQTGADPLDALIDVTNGFGTMPTTDWGFDAGYVDPMDFYY